MIWILEHWAWLLTTVSGWLLSLYIWKQGRPRWRVDVVLRWSRGHPRRREVLVTFINEQGPDVRIEEIGFEYGDRRKMEEDVYPSMSGPASFRTVLPGHSEKWSFPIEWGRSFVQRGEPIPTWLYFRDATGRYYRILWLNEEIRSALME